MHHPIIRATTILLLGLISCFKEDPIEQAPCPCPAGYVCCPTKTGCIKEGNECPQEYQPSTAQSCTDDEGCQRGEACQKWRLQDGTLAGPGKCRKLCEEPYDCAPGEICELTPRNGDSFSLMQYAKMCVPEDDIPGCSAIRCSQCNNGQLHDPFCFDDDVYGCFFFPHPVCGLQCAQQVIESCRSFGDACRRIGAVSICGLANGSNYCNDDRFDCDVCRGSLEGEGAVCVGNTLVSCLSMPYSIGACEELCIRQETPCPDGITCTTSGSENAAPLCLPEP